MERNRLSVMDVKQGVNSDSHAMAMAKRYGPASVFLTITPDDISNPNRFRLSFRSHNNKTFPAVVDKDVLQKLKEGGTHIGEGNISILLDYNAHTKAATGNLVAVALEFQVMIENILYTPIGSKPNFQTYHESKVV